MSQSAALGLRATARGALLRSRSQVLEAMVMRPWDVTAGEKDTVLCNIVGNDIFVYSISAPETSQNVFCN